MLQVQQGCKRVFKKLANIARSIAVNVSTKRTITSNYSAVNLDNVHSIPTDTNINNNITTSRDKNGLHLSLVNIRSLYSKAEELKYCIVEKDRDVCAITELWVHKDSPEESLKAFVPEEYWHIIKIPSRGKKRWRYSTHI